MAECSVHGTHKGTIKKRRILKLDGTYSRSLLACQSVTRTIASLLLRL